MKTLPAIIFIVVFATLFACQSTPETISLFNGEDLSGWHMDVPEMDQSPDTTRPFLVRDNLLITRGEPRGHLITDDEYENYRLKIEYRFPGEPGNGGVLIYASEPRALYDMFPQSIEVQMMHENAGDFWVIAEDINVPNMEERRGPEETWGGTEDDNRRILNLTDNSENPVGEWNDMVVEVLGNEVMVWVNGDLVNHGTSATADHGHIALQAEGAEMEFRKVDLTSF
ncbi:MAG: DUF1080 domain-containing protein [Balneolaceae bacterium]